MKNKCVSAVMLLLCNAWASSEELKPPKFICHSLSGDTISGRCVDVSQNLVCLQPSYTSDPVAIDVSKLLYLDIHHKKKLEIPSGSHEAQIKLKSRFGFDGDHELISGIIQQIDEKRIKLKPTYSDSIEIDRSLIEDLKVIRPESRIYSQIIDLDEWQSFGDPTGWVANDKGVVARNQDGRIAKEFELPDLVRFSMEIDWKKRLGVSLYLFASSADRPTPLNSYELRIQHSYMYMSKTVNGVQVAQPHRIKHTNYSHKSQLTHIEILMDRMNGTFITFLNGTLVHTFTDPNPTPGVMGGGIYILNGYNEPIRFKTLNIEHWNGNSDANQKHYPTPLALVDSKEKIQLANGDHVPGTIQGIDSGQLLVDTRFSTQLRIPVEKVHQIDQNSEPNQPKAEQDDARLTFNNGDQWIVQLNGVESSRLRVANKAFGRTSVDLHSLKKIEFNIYNDVINARRFNEPW